MTESKMRRILSEEIQKHGADFVIMRLLDLWAYEIVETDGKKNVQRVDKVRDTLTLNDIAISFDMKDGYLYNRYKITDNFQSLIKEINKKEFYPLEKYHLYADTKMKFLNLWKEYNPDKDYVQYEKEQTSRMMGHMMGLYSKYLNEYRSLGII